MKFAKYDKDNYQLKISKQEAKELFEQLDFLKSQAVDTITPSNTALGRFFIGLKNLSSSSDSN